MLNEELVKLGSDKQKLLFKVLIQDIARAKDRQWVRAVTAVVLQGAIVAAPGLSLLHRVVLLIIVGLFMIFLQIDSYCQINSYRKQKEDVRCVLGLPFVPVTTLGKFVEFSGWGVIVISTLTSLCALVGCC